MKCPCRGCDRRTITCHSVCRQYQEWKIYNEDRRKWLRGQKYVPTDGIRSGEIRNIKDRARGWLKKKVKNYD